LPLIAVPVGKGPVIGVENKKATRRQPLCKALMFKDKFGAGEGIRTLDPNLGKGE